MQASLFAILQDFSMDKFFAVSILGALKRMPSRLPQLRVIDFVKIHVGLAHGLIPMSPMDILLARMLVGL